MRSHTISRMAPTVVFWAAIAQVCSTSLGNVATDGGCDTPSPASARPLGLCSGRAGTPCPILNGHPIIFMATQRGMAGCSCARYAGQRRQRMILNPIMPIMPSHSLVASHAHRCHLPPHNIHTPSSHGGSPACCQPAVSGRTDAALGKCCSFPRSPAARRSNP